VVIRVHITPLLFSLFETQENDTSVLVEQMRSYYTVRGVSPNVRVDGDDILVELDVQRIIGREKLFAEAKHRCEKGKFDEGKVKLRDLVEEDPTHSEYHRMLGQVAAMQGDTDDAINHLIDALRWDPKNTYALTMMGNIWARDKDDIETALKYYQSALDLDPNDHIAVNNIATQFLQRQEWKTAGEWFQKALTIDPDYPNTLHGLALVRIQEGDVEGSFEAVTASLRHNEKRDELYRQSLKLAFDTARLLGNGKVDGPAIVQRVAEELGTLSGKPVKIKADPSIPTAAKLEMAENYGRDEHTVLFKPSYPGVEHLQLHELYHLRYASEAREHGVNELFVVRPSHKEAFIRTLSKTISKLHKEGIAEDSIAKYVSSLFEGLNRQVFNAAVDLFIEYDMHRDHPEMRPIQFLSLSALVEEAVTATTDKRIVAHSPPDVLSKSKVYNLTLAMLYRELYGVDRFADFKATPRERELAERFYDEFKEYRDDREAGEEYEVLRHWADDLGLTPYFMLVSEVEYRKTKAAASSPDLDAVLDRIEADPLDQSSNDPERNEEMRTFMDAKAAQGTDSAVIMFMVDALQHFSALPKSKVKEIAFEIAVLGTQGIEPDKQGYRLNHIPAKVFSGKHLLGYYYVSWKLAIPEMLGQLNLPYDEEFALAEQFHKAGA